MWGPRGRAAGSSVIVEKIATSERTSPMTAPTIYPNAGALGVYSAAGALGLCRAEDGLGLWPYKGKVAAVGIGHSPTLRRWDGDPQKSIGAWTIMAIRRAIEDAGVEPAQ